MAGVLQSVAPILPSRDFDATAAFYALLGFEETSRYPNYLILDAGPVELHFQVWDFDPATNDAGMYLRATGVAELAAALGVVAEERPWGQLEFHILDPDRNLIRVGEDLLA